MSPRRSAVVLMLCSTTFVLKPAGGQSALLTALEGSLPAPALEPTAPGLSRGLSVLWADPTADPRATGVFLGISHASYTSMNMVHTAVGFRLGPRWSLTMGSVDIGDLFDSALVAQDPSLASLRAQAILGRLDATFSLPGITANLGAGLAGDENVGIFHSSTIVRTALRLHPWRNDRFSLRVEFTRSAAGSLPSSPKGRRSFDLTVSRPVGRSSASFSIGASSGSVWRYSETREGIAAAVQVNILSQVDLGAATGRYRVTYGTAPLEWYRALSAAVRVAAVRVGARYVSTRLGVGSGFAVSLAYEPRFAPARSR